MTEKTEQLKQELIRRNINYVPYNDNMLDWYAFRAVNLIVESLQECEELQELSQDDIAVLQALEELHKAGTLNSAAGCIEAYEASGLTVEDMADAITHTIEELEDMRPF